jgi:putative transposase
MRLPRLKAPSHLSAAYYHCVSRVVDRRFILGDDEKGRFLHLVRFYERFSKVRVVAYCLMSNHFHILVEVPKRPNEQPSEAWLIEHVRRCYGENTAFALEINLAQSRKQAGEEAAQKILAGWFARMWDVSAFMKSLKQRFSQWFNKNSKRRGTLWEDRFRSVLVESGAALGTMATYIDLNPMRAGMVKDPADYRWCSYGAAVGGNKAARSGLKSVVNTVVYGELQDAKEEKRTTGDLPWMEQYRVWLYGSAGEIKDRRSGRTLRKGLRWESIDAVLRKAGKRKRSEMLRRRLRFMTRGGAIGSAAFVETIFNSERWRFDPDRQAGAKVMRGGDAVWSGLRTLRLPRTTGT